jgi:hypothetical protein
MNELTPTAFKSSEQTRFISFKPDFNSDDEIIEAINFLIFSGGLNSMN